MIRIAINGFGRIGRQAFKVYFDKYRSEMQVVCVNDLTDAKTLAHLLKYDTNYGTWSRTVSAENLIEDKDGENEGKQTGKIAVDGLEIATYAIREPEKLPWLNLKVDIVIESTGRFTGAEAAKGHLTAGARKVIISAPSKEVPTIVLGVNSEVYTGQNIINNASCTTNCIAPVAKVMIDAFGIKKAMMTTVHAVTAEQNIVDGPPPGGKSGDLRRARSAYQNIIPTSTGAAAATGEAIPALKGKFDGASLRVPVAVGSISDFTFLLSKKVTVDEVNTAFEEASKQKNMTGILAVTHEPLVSSDIVGRGESSIVDLSLTKVVDGDMVKVFAWYDNEFGYSNRLVEQVIQIGKSLTS